MKAKNDKEVRKGVIQFALYFVATVFFAVCIFSMFMKTSSTEVSRIMEKTDVYDKTQQKQVYLTEKIDSISVLVNLLSSNAQVNHSLVLTSLANQKKNAMQNLNAVPDKDAKLYKKILNEMDVFFNIKDSLHVAAYDEDKYRREYIRCMDEGRIISRRSSISGRR